MTSTTQVSFIIPTFNEERLLQRTLECIETYTPKSLSYEIIVADNGSEDSTIEIAKKFASVVVDANATVGRLRNLAVQVSKGDVLVFLDADVVLTESWSNNFSPTYESLQSSPYQVTGSRCTISASSSWVETKWFKTLITKDTKYINSGHLITTRKLFDNVNGFDEALETGEDYAFGAAALHINATIVNNPSLEVVHEGYPKTLLSFIKREAWHGSGDCKSLKRVFASKVALAAIVFLFLHLVLLYGVVSGCYLISAIALSLVLLMCFTAAVLKHKVSRIRDILQVTYLYYFYFTARILSCVPMLNKRSPLREKKLS